MNSTVYLKLGKGHQGRDFLVEKLNRSRLDSVRISDVLSGAVNTDLVAADVLPSQECPWAWFAFGENTDYSQPPLVLSNSQTGTEMAAFYCLPRHESPVVAIGPGNRFGGFCSGEENIGGQTTIGRYPGFDESLLVYGTSMSGPYKEQTCQTGEPCRKGATTGLSRAHVLFERTDRNGLKVVRLGNQPVVLTDNSARESYLL